MRLRTVLGALVGAAAALAVAQAEARVTEEQVAERLRSEYGVEVLDIQRRWIDGRFRYEVRVMLPADAGNRAFRVETLWVDGNSGELVPQFRHLPAGYRLSGDPYRTPTHDGQNPAARRLSHR